MALFTNADIPKHDYMYVKAVLDDLKPDPDILKKAQQYMNSNDISKLTELLKSLNWTKIDKSPYSGKGSSRTPPVTDESEQGVLLFLELFVAGVLKPSQETYEPVFCNHLDIFKFSKTKLTDQEISKSIAFLKSKEDWASSCFSSAYAIYTMFKGSLRDYTFHQNSQTFNTIRTLGSNLSKLKADKWNPADVYLIHKTFNISEIKFLSLGELNSYLGSNEKVIGISLKKSNELANHGKASLSLTTYKKRIPKRFSITVKDHKTKVTTITKDGQTMLNEYMTTISQRFDNLYYRSNEGPIFDQIRTATIKSDNYDKSLPVILDWICQHTNQADLEDSIKALVYHALSLNLLSCPHLKCYGSDKTIVQVGEKPDVAINKIFFKLNGDTDVIFEVQIKNTRYKAQIRSFGSIPQLELKKSDTGKWNTPIKLK